MRYGIPVQKENQTILTEPVDIPEPLPGWAVDPQSFLSKMFLDLSGWVLVADDTMNGAIGNGDGTYTNPQAPPAPKPAFAPTISRIRFDAMFAEALGEVAYDDALDTLLSIAATTPKTANSVAVKRTLRGLDNNPVGINRPLTDWRASQDQDLTAHFLALVASVLTPTDPDIADKIDAGLNAWPRV